MNKAVQQYIDALPKERKPLFNRLKELVLELYPAAEVKLWYRMPTFKVGKGWVALANQKYYVSLYTNSAGHIKAFKDKNPHIQTGKACLNLKPEDTVPEEDVKQVIRHAIDQPSD
jgi:uncharacterized protein YdhG (YjbR/CyaY superfamily)